MIMPMGTVTSRNIPIVFAALFFLFYAEIFLPGPYGYAAHFEIEHSLSLYEFFSDREATGLFLPEWGGGMDIHAFALGNERIAPYPFFRSFLPVWLALTAEKALLFAVAFGGVFLITTRLLQGPAWLGVFAALAFYTHIPLFPYDTHMHFAQHFLPMVLYWSALQRLSRWQWVLALFTVAVAALANPPKNFLLVASVPVIAQVMFPGLRLRRVAVFETVLLAVALWNWEAYIVGWWQLAPHSDTVVTGGGPPGLADVAATAVNVIAQRPYNVLCLVVGLPALVFASGGFRRVYLGALVFAAIYVAAYWVLARIDGLSSLVSNLVNTLWAYPTYATVVLAGALTIYQERIAAAAGSSTRHAGLLLPLACYAVIAYPVIEMKLMTVRATIHRWNTFQLANFEPLRAGLDLEPGVYRSEVLAANQYANVLPGFHGVPTFGSIANIQPSRYDGYWRAINGFAGTSTAVSWSNAAFSWETFDLRIDEAADVDLLARANVKYILSDYRLTGNPRLTLVRGKNGEEWPYQYLQPTLDDKINYYKWRFDERFRAKDFFVYRIDDALPRVFSPTVIRTFEPATALETRVAKLKETPGRDLALVSTEDMHDLPATPDRVEITSVETSADSITIDFMAPAAGIVVVNQGWSPFWSATVNGDPAPVVAANIVHMAVPLPPGRGQVQLSYERKRTFLDMLR